MFNIYVPIDVQVDIENETMRMKEGWEVWLLPNQATGKQGVPRYIKVGPSMISADPHSAPGSTEPQAAYDEVRAKKSVRYECSTSYDIVKPIQVSRNHLSTSSTMGYCPTHSVVYMYTPFRPQDLLMRLSNSTAKETNLV